MNKPYTFVFFGIVGSGKGTQIDLLQKYLKDKDASSDVVWAYPGSEFRKLTSGDSYTGALVKEKLELGFLQPDFLTISIFTSILINNLKSDNHLFADAFPRTVGQAEAFEHAMNFYKRSNVKIVYIEVGKEEATKRMKLRGRSDDTDEGIARRFDEYVNNVIPAMNYFDGKDGYEICKINGEQSVEDVHKEIIAKLGL